MPAFQLAGGLRLLGLLCQGMHLDYQLAVQEQVRAGDSYTPGTAAPNTLSFSEIVAPSAQGHATFTKASQDLLIRYQPRFLDTLQIRSGGGGAQWTGWSQMHRVLVQYQAGNERTLKLRSSINFAAGQLDISEPDGVVQESGFLPGQLGQLVNYTNLTGMVAVSHKVGRWLQLTSTETLGLIQYPARNGLGYFGTMPRLSESGTAGNETQYRVNTRNEAEVIFNQRDSLFVDLEYLDVSYQQTASYPGGMLTAGYGRTFSPVSHLRVDAGAMKYWVNPAPGIIKRPKYLPIANVSMDHTFSSWGMPHLTGHALIGVKPYFNLQFSNLEPRTTIQLQLNYQATKRLSVLGSARLLSSMFGGFRRWEQLPGGHPKNIMLVSAGVHYSYKDIIVLDCSAYASDQLYQKSATQPYAELKQVYLLMGLRGTWQKKPRG